MKKSQLERVKHKLNVDGFITRNECLRNYITRLSAIILVLKQEGWRFKAEDRNGDYVYTLIK